MLLRALNPATELHLFHEAYSWRTSPKRNTRVNRMTFDDFATDYQNQVVMGLFDGTRVTLVAVYVFIETSPKVWEAHFTSRRGIAPAIVLAGARTMVDWFHSQGAVVTAEIVARNRPVRAFVEALGFIVEKCTCQDVGVGSKLPTVKYLSRMDSHNRPDTPPVQI